MKYLYSLLCVLFSFSYVSAQEELAEEIFDSYEIPDSAALAASPLPELGIIPESLDANVDSLLNSWHVQYFAKRDEYCHDDNQNVFFPDSVYMERLERLPRMIHLPYNDVIRDCIDLYAARRRGLVRYMLGMADYFFPIIEPILDKNDLPIELKYLAVVESALNPVALSRVGACGLWQFMLPTGKSYGLEINSLIDERRDPEKATEAACKYFKDMYAIYGDWNLVLAAYNCGPGNVNKAIRRSGGKTDFWEIFQYLPKETRSYVPLFVAANYIMNYYCDHNICPLTTNMPLANDTIMVNRMLHLEQVSEMLSIDIEMLRAMNPQYKRDIIPGQTRPSALRLPAFQTYTFADKEDSVYTYRYEDLLAGYVIDSVNPASRTERITHKVANGENIFRVADKFGVTPKDIRKWNNMKSNYLAKGTRLRIYVDNGGVPYAPMQTVTTTSEVKKTTTTSAAASSKTASAGQAKASTSTAGSTATSGGNVYKVRSGDSLYSIAKKYPGVTAKDLQKENGLSGTAIRPGQILKIPVV